MKATLALFDFDGTITRHPGYDFLVFTHGWGRFFLNIVLLMPTLILHVLRAIPRDEAKRRLLARFYAGWTSQHMQQKSDVFAKMIIPRIARVSALERLAWHKSEGHRVIVVTASVEDWLVPWCAQQGIELLGTQMATADDVYTGALVGRNCRAAEKERRIREHVDLDDYAEIYAYGDTRGDTEMLALATRPFFRYFK